VKEVLVDILRPDLIQGRGDKVRKIHEVVSDGKDPVGENPGKESGYPVPGVRELAEEVSHIPGKPLREEALRLINHKKFDPLRLQEAFLVKINDATGRADDNRCVFMRSKSLTLIVLASHNYGKIKA